MSPARSSPLLLVVSALFVTVLLTSNLIAVKLVAFGPLTLPAAVVVFPLSYLFGDVLTEVYGYAVARRVIWLGFASNLVFVLFILAALWVRSLYVTAIYDRLRTHAVSLSDFQRALGRPTPESLRALAPSPRLRAARGAARA